MKRGDLVILILLLVVLIVGGFFLAAPPERQQSTKSSTYNADPMGVKAFYTLLGDRLGYRVSRLRSDYGRIPRSAGVLVVVQPEPSFVGDRPAVGISPDEADTLLGWVRKGGVVIAASDGYEGIPWQLRQTRKLGAGHLYSFDSRRMITNKGMRDYRNAIRLLELVNGHTSGRELVLFDEYHHGYTLSEEGFALGSRAKACLWMLAAAAVILAYSRGRRFGAVRNLPQSETVRPGFEFVEAVGRLYQRAGAADLAADILCGSLRQKLCLKLGLDRDASASQIAERVGNGAEVLALTQQCERPAGQKSTEQELLMIARQIHDIEEELRLVKS